MTVKVTDDWSSAPASSHGPAPRTDRGARAA